MSKSVKALLCVICLSLSACAGVAGMSEELDRSAKAYNRMLRWYEAENAVQIYADPELREDVLKKIGQLKKNGLTVTDFRILSTLYIPENKSGDVIAEFDYHIMPSNRIKTVSHLQEWVYLDSVKSWKLKNALPAFE